MISKNSCCRICESRRLTKFLSLGDQPPSNQFIKEENLEKSESLYPLDVYFCHQCNLIQLIDVVDKDELYRDYVYFSSAMPKISPHWQSYADEVMGRFLSDPQNLVVEMGSNDGVLLKYFKEKGFRILGVDPARNIAAQAERNGVPTLADFFSDQLAGQILNKYGKARAILANNVFAHINNHHSAIGGVKKLLSEDGVFVIEAPYILDMFERLAYDSIYHEHLSYVAIRPLLRLVERFGLEVFDARIFPVQGNSLRLFIGFPGRYTIQPSVENLIQKERDWQFNCLNTYQILALRIKNSKNELVALLRRLKSQGKRIAGFGAPARGNTLLNYCNITQNLLDYILDDLPSPKQGKYTPGTHIKIVDNNYAGQNPVDYYLLLSWNYLDAILEKQKEFRHKGGKFIVPIGLGDELRII